MKNYNFIVFVMFFFLLMSSNSYSLGVGDITIQSKLGEPFLAQLKLLHSEDLSNDQVHIYHAMEASYKRLGVERKHIYSTLRFERNDDIVIISTIKPITEPYLNFVLEIKWPTGQIIKAFEILIDP